jgi:nickel/cobalt transporter (NicO) family protein
VQDTAIVFLGIIAFGLLHGINPSHGWTVAVLYSIRNKRPLLSSLTSSSILAGAHFLSSIVVLAAFLFVTMFIQIPQTYLNYAVAAALGILAYLFWKEKTEDLIETQHGHQHHDFTEQLEHEHEHWHSSTGSHTHIHLHQKRSLPTLAAIAGFALVLGFAHEEEFVILTLAVGGINPLLLMIAYATAVAAGLIGVTVIAVKIYSYIQHKVILYTK